MTAPESVTQADRKAATSLWEATDGLWSVSHEQLAALLARHRQSAEAASREREAELESLLAEAAMGLACLSHKLLDTDIAQAAPLVARINAALAHRSQEGEG